MSDYSSVGRDGLLAHIKELEAISASYDKSLGRCLELVSGRVWFDEFSMIMVSTMGNGMELQTRLVHAVSEADSKAKHVRYAIINVEEL